MFSNIRDNIKKDDYLRTIELLAIEKDQSTTENMEYFDKINKKLDELNAKYKELVNKTVVPENKELTELILSSSWLNIPNSHKINQVDKYLSIRFKHAKVKEKILEKLSKHIVDGKLNNSKNIKYDKKNMRIISIPALVIDKQNKTFKVIIK